MGAGSECVRGEFVEGPRGGEFVRVEVHADSECGACLSLGFGWWGGRGGRGGRGVGGGEREDKRNGKPSCWRLLCPSLVCVIKVRFAVMG